MDERLSGHVGVVTGGASGIGRGIAKRFAQEGADVVVADLQSEPREDGRPTHVWIQEETDADATFVECDVSDPESFEVVMDAADEFGGVTAMVNNAGIVRQQPFLEVTPDDFGDVLGVNLKGTFFGAQAAARRMIESGTDGAIVNVSSTAGIRGSPGLSTYCSSKGGVRLLTYSLAAELGGEGIRVNAIHPGMIETAMTTDDVPMVGTDAGEDYREENPLHTWGQPEDVAAAAAYLVSDDASFVNGESLVVDGGDTSSA